MTMGRDPISETKKAMQHRPGRTMEKRGRSLKTAEKLLADRNGRIEKRIRKLLKKKKMEARELALLLNLKRGSSIKNICKSITLERAAMLSSILDIPREKLIA